MEITSNANIFKVLTGLNEHWNTGQISVKLNQPLKRTPFYESKKRLLDSDINRIILITGSRRTGKTTIMYQLMQELLDRGHTPENLFYASFDQPLLKLCNIAEIIENYHNNINPKGDVYYFFDEIQYASDWDRWLKHLYDQNPKIKIMATGSASPVLERKNRESGVGRWTIIKVPTMTFYEYCELLQIKKPFDKRPSIEKIIKMEISEQNRLFMKLQTLEKYFNRYLLYGGFPEFALKNEDDSIFHFMREDIVDKVLKRDIPALYSIRSINDLERIFLYLCYHSSNIINIETIAKELNGVTRPTVEKYIAYLESANLINISRQLDATGKKVLKAQPKIYIADSGIRNSVMMNTDVLTNAAEMGIVVETAVYNHIKNYYNQFDIGYVHDKKEIDIAVNHYTNKVLVEVKYRETYDMAKDDITRLADESTLNLLVTKKALDYGKLKENENVFRIPAFALMYLIG